MSAYTIVLLCFGCLFMGTLVGAWVESIPVQDSPSKPESRKVCEDLWIEGFAEGVKINLDSGTKTQRYPASAEPNKIFVERNSDGTCWIILREGAKCALHDYTGLQFRERVVTINRALVGKISARPGDWTE